MIGPVILDLEGLALTEEEKTLLQHAYVGGVILFARNINTPKQVLELTQSIRAINPDLLISVDQEGGRVQRLKEGFTKLPPMRTFGKMYNRHPDKARRYAEMCGWLMATEVLSVGIDFSFAPVLDLDFRKSKVIGDRAWHFNPYVTADLAQLFVYGMHQAGMPAVIKHFPGHGKVRADSHLAVPVDRRTLAEVVAQDMIPFKRLIHAGAEAVMPAHIIFPKVDNKPVGFSERWLRHYLRDQLHFDGVIFSDDLSMKGAAPMGSFADRALFALKAGCDMVLICNHRTASLEILENLPKYFPLEQNHRLAKMRGVMKLSRDILLENPNWQHTKEKIEKL